MTKKTKKQKEQDTAKELADVCLHCAFFKMHQDKWPDWKPSDDNETEESSRAFNDLVRSAVKITAEVFTMLDPMDQMKFMRNVMTTATKAELGISAVDAVKELLERFRQDASKARPNTNLPTG